MLFERIVDDWSCREFRMKLRRPFQTAAGSRTDVLHFLFTAHGKGQVGFGFAVPPKTMDHRMAQRTAQRFCDDLNFEEFSSPNWVRAGRETAYWDLKGKLNGASVGELLGIAAQPLSSTFTVGIATPGNFSAGLGALKALPAVKFKLGHNPDLKIIEAFGRNYRGRMQVDANGSWDRNLALEVTRDLDQLGVAVLEQPVAAEDLGGLQVITKASRLQVVADETLANVSTVGELKSLVDGINVKVSRAGGLRGAINQIRSARAAGLSVQIGCSVESVLGISAAAHLGPLADWLDLDGAMHLYDDPFEGMRFFEGRVAWADGGLGLGCRFVNKSRTDY